MVACCCSGCFLPTGLPGFAPALRVRESRRSWCRTTPVWCIVSILPNPQNKKSPKRDHAPGASLSCRSSRFSFPPASPVQSVQTCFRPRGNVEQSVASHSAFRAAYSSSISATRCTTLAEYALCLAPSSTSSTARASARRVRRIRQSTSRPIIERNKPLSFLAALYHTRSTVPSFLRAGSDVCLRELPCRTRCR